MSRIAVVTGANKGIGFHIALQLAASGKFGTVVLATRDAGRGQQAVRDIKGQLAAGAAEVTCEQLVLGDAASHAGLRDTLERKYGKLDVLVNNAAIAFKGSDPTPFQQQCTPTLDVNLRGTVDLTQRLLPLLRKGSDPRIVNVASFAGSLGQIRSPALRDAFTAPDLTVPKLLGLVDAFEKSVMQGTHRAEGWGNSNYGFSKLALIAATRVWARTEPGVRVNACCPGYCVTDMTSGGGTRHPSEGAKNAVIPATAAGTPTGEFYSDFRVARWA